MPTASLFRRGTARPRALCLIGLLLTGGVLLTCTEQADGQKAEQIVVVPACARPLQVAVDVPAGAVEEPSRAEGWRLSEIGGQRATAAAQLVPAVVEDGRPAPGAWRLVAEIPPGKAADGPRRFRLEPRDEAARTAFGFEMIGETSIKLSQGKQPVLTYNYGTITDPKVPQDDPRRSRACYIHPLFGLKGEVLTEDFPKDHYHHHGVFWTWPHVGIDGKQYDLWADAGGIKQRLVSWLGRYVGPAAAVLGVENGWFVDGRKVMVERVWMRPFTAVDGARAVDLDLVFIPVDRPVTLWGAGGKSYGGLTVRFRMLPRKDVAITVPSGPAAEDLYETPLAWVDYTATYPDSAGKLGAAIMVPPDHPDYPPTWLTRYYGPQCIGWPGVKPKTFEPGVPIRLSYRIWVHEGAADFDTLKRAYDAYLAARQSRWEQP
jgi:hypothetical protein